MRVGNNPLRLSPAEKFAPVVLCVVTHLPNQEGYHADRLEVIQTCLRSMTQNIGVDGIIQYSLAVWDNGSCNELRDWIEEEIRPDIFVKSFNIGKTDARTALIRMIPPKHIIAYSDDDMYFYPNWLIPQIDLLQYFPNVAAVTGYPVRTASRWACENTIQWAKANGKTEYGQFIPRSWEDDFCISIGRDPAWHAETSKNDREARVTYEGKMAYCLGHHCQFIGYQERLVQVATWDGRAMGDEKIIDYALDTIGLRLATIERYSRHIGNVLHDELRQEIMQTLMPA